MLKISFAGCLGLSRVISTQFTLEMCVSASNRQKNALKPLLGGSRSFKVIDVCTPWKLVSKERKDQNACVEAESVACVALDGNWRLYWRLSFVFSCWLKLSSSCGLRPCAYSCSSPHTASSSAAQPSSLPPPPLYRHVTNWIRDDHGNGIPNGNGNPMGFPWEWELVTKLGMGMGRNGKREWEWPLFPCESIPIGGYKRTLARTRQTACCFCVAICRLESSASDDNFDWKQYLW